jgi:hypothetical protein
MTFCINNYPNKDLKRKLKKFCINIRTLVRNPTFSVVDGGRTGADSGRTGADGDRTGADGDGADGGRAAIDGGRTGADGDSKGVDGDRAGAVGGGAVGQIDVKLWDDCAVNTCNL